MSTEYLVNHLPPNNNVISDAKYLQPMMRQKGFGLNAVSRLAFSLAGVLGDEEMRKIFPYKKDLIKYDLSDKI